MKKVSILSLHLGYGGIEKSICALANMLVDNYDVEIITSYKLYDKVAFKLDDRVKVNYLITRYKPNREKWKDSIKKVKPISFIKESYKSIMTLMLRKSTMVNAIKNCNSDIIISTRDIFNTWLSKYGKRSVYRIGWEHNHHHGNISYANKIVKSVMDLDAFVLVSDSLKSFYKNKLKECNSKCKCVSIPNVLEDVPNTLSKLKNKRIISVGRLSREKSFCDLIDIFEIVHRKRPGWQLDIIGDGAQRNLIGDKIYSYKLNDCVKLHGYQDKEYINDLFLKSSIYAMTSVTESFGIVLIEAMSYGIPCIAFDSAEGACDLINNNKNGILIENRDKEKYANKLIELIDNKDLRMGIGKQGRETSLMYSKDKIKEEWISLLKRK